MPFDPSLPTPNSAIESAVLRGQFTSLHTDVQTRVTQGALEGAIASTASNCNGVAFLDFAISDPPDAGRGAGDLR